MANRNSYRVAMIRLVDTQGSVLRPQPWAGESQLHYLSAEHCATPVTFGSELPRISPIPIFSKEKVPYTNAFACGGCVNYSFVKRQNINRE